MAEKPAKYASEEAKGKLAPATFRHGRTRVLSDVITLASQAVSDTIPIGKLPSGARVTHGMITTGTSLGSSRPVVGTAADDDVFTSSLTVTSTTAPVFFANGAPNGALGKEALDAETEVIVTVKTAAFPSSGTAVVTLFYVVD